MLIHGLQCLFGEPVTQKQREHSQVGYFSFSEIIDFVVDLFFFFIVFHQVLSSNIEQIAAGATLTQTSSQDLVEMSSQNTQGHAEVFLWRPFLPGDSAKLSSPVEGDRQEGYAAGSISINYEEWRKP